MSVARAWEEGTREAGGYAAQQGECGMGAARAWEGGRYRPVAPVGDDEVERSIVGWRGPGWGIDEVKHSISGNG
jgi:hypothetical protein